MERPKHYSTDLAVQELQRIAEQMATESEDGITAAANLKDKSVGTSDTRLEHGLGRQPRYWVVTDKQADARIWRTDWDKNSITLRASATVTASFRVW